jgi:hypothetical protein
MSLPSMTRASFLVAALLMIAPLTGSIEAQSMTSLNLSQFGQPPAPPYDELFGRRVYSRHTSILRNASGVDSASGGSLVRRATLIGGAVGLVAGVYGAVRLASSFGCPDEFEHRGARCDRSGQIFAVAGVSIGGVAVGALVGGAVGALLDWRQRHSDMNGSTHRQPR